MKEAGSLDELLAFISENRPLFVLTGAGCSTASGIPDYRDAHGNWKHKQPIQYQDFINNEQSRQRYWARSYFGWPRMGSARPNTAHYALARLERLGCMNSLVTQNVDDLHQKAGHRAVINLHGSVGKVCCLGCAAQFERESIQEQLHDRNPDFFARIGDDAKHKRPDGDIQFDIDATLLSDFVVPHCTFCRGALKPDVVFFGEVVPRRQVEMAFDALARARGVLVVGSSLTVYSGYRFCRRAAREGKPLAVVNIGRTRADAELDLKIDGPCGDALTWVVQRLDSQN